MSRMKQLMEDLIGKDGIAGFQMFTGMSKSQ